ncbi:Ribosomal protein L18ae family [Striga hermonthica]|uniref:Ribosomal protein L18ae family n=1 Tax=Striga hermonthica TaxID=68872 RepID=A0A9N7RP08_STRHE|nr:Ribosomal protein L18ae family [Striga hermonthica]
MSGLIGVTDPSIEEEEGRKALEIGISVSDKHLDLLRPSARYYSIFKGKAMDSTDREKGKYSLIRGEDDTPLGLYDKPLPCFGCGIGWFSFLLGFLCPLMWYYATILYFGNYYRKDPRERAGLAASAIAAMGCSVILLIVVLVLIF